MKMDDIIGDIVYISLREIERYSPIGILESQSHFLVRGYDQFGLWVAHPGLLVITSEDKKGEPLKPDMIIKEEVEATFLISWDNILTIMHYPDRKGFDFPSEFQKKYGFTLKKKE